MNIEAIEVYLRHIGYKIEEALIYIFGDDGRRYAGDQDEL